MFSCLILSATNRNHNPSLYNSHNHPYALEEIIVVSVVV